eukprot:TRINITY_DN12416_c4_g5_i1.p1 TRINITY_DN12416_c4_g5~~TRINITY_DN12416_c4_g5_i1.p1  ORF type:complete len:370 (+),score=105.93 TRINITY_DN12416_c4_g5_i1:165-1274(+)
MAMSRILLTFVIFAWSVAHEEGPHFYESQGSLSFRLPSFHNGTAAQGIVTDGSSDRVWLSWQDRLHKGTLTRNSDGSYRSITVEKSNYEALANTGADYHHISDGDLIKVKGREELWFGLEGANWPRTHQAAVVRYDANTLAFISMHQHPVLRVMAWLAYDTRTGVAYTSDWTNAGMLFKINVDNVEFDSNPVTITGLKRSLDYVQGGDIHDGILYMLADDEQSTLLQVDLDTMRATYFQRLGLGYEREGMALLDDADILLSLGNRWQNWDNTSFGQVLVLTTDEEEDKHESKKLDNRSLGLGFMMSLLVVLVLASFVIICRKRHRAAADRYKALHSIRADDGMLASDGKPLHVSVDKDDDDDDDDVLEA